MTAYIGQSGEQTNYEAIVKQHENTIQSSLEVDASNNAVSAGPITIATSSTVTVSGTWVIV